MIYRCFCCHLSRFERDWHQSEGRVYLLNDFNVIVCSQSEIGPQTNVVYLLINHLGFLCLYLCTSAEYHILKLLKTSQKHSFFRIIKVVLDPVFQSPIKLILE